MAKSYSIKNNNGTVTYLMRVSVGFVKYTMPLETAQKLISKAAEVKETTTVKDYPLSVDDKYFFPLEDSKKSSKE